MNFQVILKLKKSQLALLQCLKSQPRLRPCSCVGRKASKAPSTITQAPYRTVSYNTSRDDLTLDVLKSLPSCTRWRVHERIQPCTRSVGSTKLCDHRGMFRCSLLHQDAEWSASGSLASLHCGGFGVHDTGDACRFHPFSVFSVGPGLTFSVSCRGEEICLGSGWHCWCRGPIVTCGAALRMM